MDNHYGGQSPSHGAYNVQSTYFPPDSPNGSYVPPSVDDNPFAGSAAGMPSGPSHTADDIVPAISISEFTAVPVSQPGMIPFQDSNLAAHSVSGKIGPSEVPRVASFPDNRSLLQGHAPSAPLGGDDSASNTNYSFLNLKSCRKYFNVDTEDVLMRMRDSVLFFKVDFLNDVSDNADLYGPFWIATTLIFVSAVTGNYANYISYKASHEGGTGDSAWYYDVDKVGYSAILFYGYVGVVGLLLWAALKFVFKAPVALASIWCAYGYALSIFIPISFFCIFNIEWLRWTLVAVATATSGLFLLTNFRGPIFDSAGAKALPVWLAVGAIHLALGLVLKLYFFHYW